MAHKGDDRHIEFGTGASPDSNADTSEFENAVTTEIGNLVTRAFDGDSDVSVVNVDVSPHVESATDDALAPGFMLNDRFEIVELVHSGGMGHVYKAVDYRRHHTGALDIHVAIKMMRPQVTPRDEAQLALEREAAKARSLSHPNIINIFDFDEYDGQFYLVMEWLDGESVNALLRRTSGEQLAPKEAWSIIENTAAAIGHAHLHNVVHADINPSNIFITRSKEIKLLDFGVARYTDESEKSADTRFAWVTRTYASPEVLDGLPPVYEDDVFSLGCVAYRLLSGAHPFGGSASIVAKQLGVKLKPINDLADSDWEILRRSLAYTREDRSIPVSAFIRHRTSALPTSIGARPYSGMRRLWPLIASIAAVAVIAGGAWILQREALDDAAPVARQAQTAKSASDATEAATAQSPLGLLLTSAAQAMEQQRLVTPEDGNARGLYRAVLAIDSTNSSALRGLRAISDVYVQQANQAIRAGDPIRATSALEIAAETDPDNPAIMITNELLIAQGDRQLAAARLAVAEGDRAGATESLSVAGKYAHIDEIALSEIRLQLSQNEQEAQFMAGLATAEAHISAGRLTAPAEENAQTVLTALYQQHGDDARLLTSMERLGERLLTRAAFATAAGEFASAGELIDVVDTLGVLSPDVAAARVSLQGAMGAAYSDQKTVIAGDAGVTSATPISGADSEPLPTAADSNTTVATSEESEFVESGAGEIALLPVPENSVDEPTTDAAAVSNETISDEPEELRVRKLEELGIRSYVAPRYPRRAFRRGISGFVDVAFEVNRDGRTGAIRILNAEPDDIFNASAEDAVSRWRFARQENVVKARVTVRFDAGK